MRLGHPMTGSLAMLLGIMRFMRRSRLQAEAVTGRGDGDVFERVECRFGFKQTFESQTPFFQEANIRLAVSH